MKYILTADWHLRDDKPRCRLDNDWRESQYQAMLQIVNIANKHNAPLLIIGDIFHWPTVSDQMKTMFFSICATVKNGVYPIAGNHDLPAHNIKNIYKSSIGLVLSLIGQVNIFDLRTIGRTAHFGGELSGKDSGLYFIHRLVFKDKMPDYIDGITAQELLDEYPDAKVICTGDNHTSFDYESEDGRVVINPGCITRQRSDFKDYDPLVYVLDDEKMTFKKEYIEDKVELVTDEYIKKEEERNERVDAFIDTIKSTADITLDFFQNIEDELRTNKEITKGAIQMARKIMEEVRNGH